MKLGFLHANYKEIDMLFDESGVQAYRPVPSGEQAPIPPTHTIPLTQQEK